MTNKQAYLALLSGLVFLLTGCDLLKVFSEGKGQPKLSRVELVDLVTPLPPRSPLLGEPPRNSQPIKQQRTSICAEFSSMAVSDLPTSPWPIFVDAKVAQSGSGSSWKDAVKSVGEGLRKAQWQRQQWVASANKDRPILVVVAGGTYSFDHERAAKQASGGGAMSDGASLLAFTGVQFSNGIEVLGGYFPGDPCREIAINLQDNPSSALGRETILDGKDKSDHVILLMADDPAHTKDIAIKDLTIRGGHAQGNDLADAVLSKLKKMGGAIAIRGSANHIDIERVKLANSSADKSGGCIAITQKANNIKLDEVSFDNCSAVEDGGAMYIADSAKIISIDNTVATNNQAGRNGGALAITSADVVANSGLALLASAADIYTASVDNIEVKNSNFNTNQAVKAGGGVAIVKTNLDPAHVPATNIEPVFAPNISFTNTKINANKVTDAAAEGGGGLALLDKVDQIFISGGEISNNESAAGHGDGVLIKDSVHEVKLDGVIITANKFSAGAHNGVGLAVIGIAGKEIKALSISGGQISDHLGSTNGSGLYVVRAEGVFLKGNVLFSGNIAQSGGGAYLDQVKNLSIDGVFCINNFASVGSGGGVYLAKTHLLAHARVAYSANAAVQDGGALYVSGSYGNTLALTDKAMPMDNINCQSNHAVRHGGCAYIQNAPDTVIRGGRYYQNGKQGQAGNPLLNIARSQYGGAIYYLASGVADTLKVVGTANADDRFHDNEAEHEGGALYVQNLKNLSIENAKFNLNKVFDANSSGGAVSGIFLNDSTVKIGLGSSFLANDAKSDGGALYLGDNLELLHVGLAKFTRNHSANGHGGAIYAGFMANMAHTDKLWLQAQASFDDNRALGVAKKGGGVYIARAPHRVELAASFADNRANNGGGGISFSGVQAINALETYDQTTFTNNTTNSNNGGGMLVEAIVAVSSDLKGTYKSNQAPLGQGAGVAYLGNLPAAVFKTNGAKFDGNVASQNPAIYLAKIPAAGLEFVNTDFKNHKSVNAGCGGVMNIAAPINSLTFYGGEISGNDTHLAANGHGGAFCAQLVNMAITITGHTANNNTANNGAGGFLYVADNVASPDITINNSSFGANKALGGDGGAIRIQNIGQLSIERSYIGSNKSSGNGGAIAVSSASGDVEIKNNASSVANLYRSIFRRAWGRERKPSDENNEKITKVIANQAGIDGGAFYFQTISGNIRVDNQVWLGNKASINGGAFYAGAANVDLGTSTKIISTILYGNEATQSGGAFYLNNLHGKNLEISQIDRFAGVTSPFIQYLKDRKLRIADGDFYDAGRALLLNNLGNLNNTDVPGNKRGMFLIEGNTAGSNGGAVYVNNVGNVDITNMSFANNTATVGSGGTIYLTGLAETATINDSIIYGGGASVNAGGLYVAGGGFINNSELILFNSSLQKSQLIVGSASCAGGIFASDLTRIAIQNSNFYDNVVNSNNALNNCSAVLRLETFIERAPVIPVVADFIDNTNNLADNTVLGPAATRSLFSVPNSLYIGAPNRIGGVATPFVIGVGNTPPPVNGDTATVVLRH